MADISHIKGPDNTSYDIKDATARSDISNKVSKSGDTMTGNLGISTDGSSTFSSKSSVADASKTNNNVTSTLYPCWNALDSSNRILARVEACISPSGPIESYWHVRNYDTSGSLTGQKGIKISMAKDGTLTYIVDDKGKFVTALGLANVATSGSYNDLSNKPTIPTKTSQLTNDTIFGRSNDLGTKNTYDTWIPVMSGNKWQHRELSATFNGKSINGGTNFNNMGIDGNHRILMFDQDGASVRQSCFRAKVMSWGSSSIIYARRNSTCLGVVMLNIESNTETFHIVCNGSPSSWKFRRIDNISNAYIANLTAGILSKGGEDFAVIYVQSSRNFSMGVWFVSSNTDSP